MRWFVLLLSAHYIQLGKNMVVFPWLLSSIYELFFKFQGQGLDKFTNDFCEILYSQ